jgi:hypothetical protein
MSRKNPAKQAAKAAGQIHFLAQCQKHGVGVPHYTTSGRCVACSKEITPEMAAQKWVKIW